MACHERRCHTDKDCTLVTKTISDLTLDNPQRQDAFLYEWSNTDALEEGLMGGRHSDWPHDAIKCRHYGLKLANFARLKGAVANHHSHC